MTLKILDIDFSICQVADYSQVDFEQDFIFIAKTARERSLVCPSHILPKNTTATDAGWRGFFIDAQLDFSLVGILASIASILAEKDIPIFAISSFDTDYILVKESFWEKALSAVLAAGYELET